MFARWLPAYIETNRLYFYITDASTRSRTPLQIQPEALKWHPQGVPLRTYGAGTYLWCRYMRMVPVHAYFQIEEPSVPLISVFHNVVI